MKEERCQFAEKKSRRKSMKKRDQVRVGRGQWRGDEGSAGVKELGDPRTLPLDEMN